MQKFSIQDYLSNGRIIEEVLTEFRRKRGYTPTMLARKADCTCRNIIDYENPRSGRGCTFARLVNILNALDVQLTIENRSLNFTDLMEGGNTMTIKTNYSDDFITFNEEAFEVSVFEKTKKERKENEEEFKNILDELDEQGFIVDRNFTGLNGLLNDADEYSPQDLATIYKDQDGEHGPRLILYVGGGAIYNVFNLEKFFSKFNDTDRTFIKKAIYYHLYVGASGSEVFNALTSCDEDRIIELLPYLESKISLITEVLDSNNFIYNNKDYKVLKENESIGFTLGICKCIDGNHPYYRFDFGDWGTHYFDTSETPYVLEALKMAPLYYEDKAICFDDAIEELLEYDDDMNIIYSEEALEYKEKYIG